MYLYEICFDNLKVFVSFLWLYEEIIFVIVCIILKIMVGFLVLKKNNFYYVKIFLFSKFREEY